MDEPRIYVQVTQKFNVGDYESVDVTIGLSQIPATAGDSLIEEMLYTSGRAFEMIAKEVSKRGNAMRQDIQRERARGTVQGQPTAGYDEPTRPKPNAFRKKQAEPAEEVRSTEDSIPAGLPASPADGLFGIKYGMPVDPRPEHFGEPIQASQLKTIKALLSKATTIPEGPIVDAGQILQGLVFAIHRRGDLHSDYECKSPSNLTRGEATIIIDWLSQATAVPVVCAAVAGETFDPFDDRGERYSSEGLVRAGA